MNTSWSHLPNAVLIDRIIASEKAYSHAWYQIWDAGIARAWYVARDSAWTEARVSAWDAVRGPTYDTTRGSVLALIAYDYSAKYLDMSSEELKIWAALSEDPAAVLMLPAVIAFEKINELRAA